VRGFYRKAKESAEFAKKIFPRVLAETPVPPGPYEDHWKGNDRRGLPACSFSFPKQVVSRLSFAAASERDGR
jgi:hypothetical protein